LKWRTRPSELARLSMSSTLSLMKSNARGRTRKLRQKSVERKFSAGLALLYVVRLRYVAGNTYRITSDKTNQLNG
jgi:hypothetical protein